MPHPPGLNPLNIPNPLPLPSDNPLFGQPPEWAQPRYFAATGFNPMAPTSHGIFNPSAPPPMTLGVTSPGMQYYANVLGHNVPGYRAPLPGTNLPGALPPGVPPPPATVPGTAARFANRPPSTGLTPAHPSMAPGTRLPSSRSIPWQVRLGQLGRGVAGPLGAVTVGPAAGTWTEEGLMALTGNERLAMAGGQAVGAGVTLGGLTRSPGVGLAAAAFGAGAGALGVDMSDVWGIGRLFPRRAGEREGVDDDGGGQLARPAEPTDLDTINATFGRVLTGLGADQAFVNRAQQGLAISIEMNPGIATTPEDLQALGMQVLETYITQWSAETDRAYYESSVAAAQAWMEPYLRQQLGTTQWYADNTAAQATAAAEQISDPGLREALKAQAAMYSQVQAAANSYALQQMMFYPEQLLEQVAANYEATIAGLQAENEMAAGFGYGFYVAPLPAEGALPPGAVAFDPSRHIVPPSTYSERTVRAVDYDPLPSQVGATTPGGPTPHPVYDVLANAPPTATPPTTTTTTVPSRSRPPIEAGGITPGTPGIPGPGPFGPPTTAPGSEQSITDRSSLVRWMGDLISADISREGAIGYAVANGLDPAAAASAYDEANAADRSIPPTGTTTPSGFAGELGGTGGLIGNLGGTGGRGRDRDVPTPEPTAEASRILASMRDDPSDGELQAVYNALRGMGYNGTDANQLIRNELAGPSGRIGTGIRDLRNPLPQSERAPWFPPQPLQPLSTFPNPTGGLYSVPPDPVPDTSRPAGDYQIYENYGMFPDQINDLINRTRFVAS